MKHIEYHINITKPHTHMVEVTAEFPAQDSGIMEVSIPAWVPGAYMIMDYCKNIFNMTARNEKGKSISCDQVAKGTWRVNTSRSKKIIFTYDVYAGKLSDHTSHVDSVHAHLTGPQMFIFSEYMRDVPTLVKLSYPDKWKIVTGMDPVPAHKNTFTTSNYDELVDAEIEIGNFDIIRFNHNRIPYGLVICGKGNYKKDLLKKDVIKIVKTVVKLFKQKTPFKRYYFILHLIPEGIEGLEHLATTSLLYPSLKFRDKEGYALFLSLVSHEFYHAWNVKAIKPADFDHYDYLNEDYTTMLWIAEGLTNYYGDLVLRHSGFWERDDYFKHITMRIQQLLSTPGRKMSSLEKASFDTWFRHYKPDQNTPNVSVSYYRKGELIGLMLDLRIRHITKNKRSLDDVMRKLYRIWESEHRGVSEDEFQNVVENVAGESFKTFFKNYVAGTAELPLSEYLAYAGLKLEKTEEKPKKDAFHPHIPVRNHGEEDVYLGVQTRVQDGNIFASVVFKDSAAHKYGLNAGDELLSLDGYRVSEKNIEAILAAKKPGDTITMYVARRGYIKQLDITLGKKENLNFKIVVEKSLKGAKRKILDSWLGK